MKKSEPTGNYRWWYNPLRRYT